MVANSDESVIALLVESVVSIGGLGFLAFALLYHLVGWIGGAL